MKLIGGFIMLLMGFGISQGNFDIYTILWFLLGAVMVFHVSIKEMIVYFWKAKYERK